MILNSDNVLNEKVIEHRQRVRNVYSTEEGQQELFNLIYDCCLTSPITPDLLAMRNYAVKKLTEMGLFDEAVIRKMIKNWLCSTPEIDEYARLRRQRDEKEKKDHLQPIENFDDLFI